MTAEEMASLHDLAGMVMAQIEMMHAIGRVDPVLEGPVTLVTGDDAAAPGTPAWQARIATLTHVALYALLLAIPLSGWVVNSSAGFPLQWFGLFNLPAIAGKDQGLHALAEQVHEWLFWTLVLVAVATFCQNLTGFAFGLIFVGIAGASSLLSIADAANIASLLSLVQAVGFMRANRLKPDWGLLGPLLGSSAVGLVAGVLLLQWLSGNMLSMLRILLGVSIVVCAVLLLRQKQVQAEMSGKPAQWTAGIASGLLGGLFATPGPPLVYHLYRQPLDRLVIVHCLISMGVGCGVVRLGMVALDGQITSTVLLWTAAAAPVVALVTWWTSKYPPPIAPRIMQTAVCVLLILSGVSLLVSGWLMSQQA